MVNTDNNLKIPHQTATKAKEKIWSVVNAFQTGRGSTLVTVIPRAVRESLSIAPGTRFLVKSDQLNRIVLEPLREEAEFDG
jgi:hypothetical protein